MRVLLAPAKGEKGHPSGTNRPLMAPTFLEPHSGGELFSSARVAPQDPNPRAGFFDFNDYFIDITLMLVR